MGKNKPKCVIGEIRAMPNILIWEQALSDYFGKPYVGFCKGDSVHGMHLLVIRSVDYKRLKWDKSSTIKPELRKRLFERETILRCPEGRVFMKLQKTDTKKLNIPTVDILRCRGRHRGDHPPHYVRLEHGILAMKVPIDGKTVEIPILIVLTEEKSE